MSPGLSVVIPALNPDQRLGELVRALLSTAAVSAVVIVDDGSSPEHLQYFDVMRGLPALHILKHAVCQGKGAALKTGIDYVLRALPATVGVVTVDADGQHHPDDVIKVAKALEVTPECLILGVRSFQQQVPWRSRVGNSLTRRLARVVLGTSIADTQTGLRAIPRSLLPRLLEIPSAGYEFETDMLIACKHHSVAVREAPIRTIYIDGNKSSHFKPILDSFRIYNVLFRFAVVALITAVIDNVIFYAGFQTGLPVAMAQILGRGAAAAFNYNAARKAVFFSHRQNSATLPRYIAALLVFGISSYGLLSLLTARYSMSVLAAKLVSETALFLLNFIVQRDLVFTMPPRAEVATDWTKYYKAPFFAAAATRRYTGSVLLQAFKRIVEPGLRPVIVEIGGGNSCFLDAILKHVQPSRYVAVDKNELGLELLRRRTFGSTRVIAHSADVLGLSLDMTADVVFSVGLIEHFDPAATRRAILAHFDCVKPGGHVILSFPTPTWLYRSTRFLAELAHQWKFPDERPLKAGEVSETVRELGTVLHERVLWPLILTQRFMVIRKHS